MKYLTALLLMASVIPAYALTTFQNSCSNIQFAYAKNQPTIQAVCLKADGATNSTSLVLKGISNNNGILTQGTGASSFQKSCGNIQIQVDGPNTTLTAICATSSGQSNSTSLPLRGIDNHNGTLTQ